MWMTLNYNFITFDLDSHKKVTIHYTKFLKLAGRLVCFIKKGRKFRQN